MEREKKKPTNAQLLKRIKDAIVFIPKTKDTKEIFFSDKGVRLVVDNDGCVIETNFHRSVYSNITSSGLSRPYLYTRRAVEIAYENLEAIKTESGYSFGKLLGVLKEKGNKAEYNIMYMYDWFLFCSFQPVYGIGEDEITQFLLYEDYMHNIARNAVLLKEHDADVTNKQFVNMVLDNMREFTDGLEEAVLLHKKSDEELAKENIEAMQEQENEQAMEAQLNGGNVQ